MSHFRIPTARYGSLTDSKLVAGKCRKFIVRAVSAPDADKQSQTRKTPSARPQYSYTSSDGKRKASLEDALTGSRADLQTEQTGSWVKNQPWGMSWQMSERNLNWNDDLAARLIKRVTAEELNCTDGEMEKRFTNLLAVLPGLTQRMHTMNPKVLAKLTEDPPSIAERLLQLKAIFPSANVQQMALRNVTMLLPEQNIQDIQAAANELRDLLPKDVNVDRLCQEHPSMLDVASFKEALTEVKRLMPSVNISVALNTEPEIIFSTQRAKSMIPYDPVPGS